MNVYNKQQLFIMRNQQGGRCRRGRPEAESERVCSHKTKSGKSKTQISKDQGDKKMEREDVAEMRKMSGQQRPNIRGQRRDIMDREREGRGVGE